MAVTRKISLYALVGLFAFAGFFGALSVQAAETCECYCNVDGTGATKVPDENTKVTISDCQNRCQKLGYSVVTCAFKTNQKPQFNVSCFTPDECSAQKGVLTASGSGTPNQPGDCKQGMYYCYPDPATRKEATLQVPIAGLTVTGDLGEYVSEAYKWMLGAGTTIAIVFLMVAGLRWTLGGANAEQIGKAKKTIVSAITGLILLLSTYLITYTVNPYLVRLQVPAFPMIKQISLVGKESCGYLIGLWGPQPYLVRNGAPFDSQYAAGGDPGIGYTIENPSNGAMCGSVADVIKDSEGNAVADDTTCIFNYCPISGQRCFISAGGGSCHSCDDFAYNKTSPISPVTYKICSQFSSCIHFSKDTISSQIASWLGVPTELSEWTKDTFCYSCEGRKCSEYNDEFCFADPCKLGCEFKTVGVGERQKTICSDK